MPAGTSILDEGRLQSRLWTPHLLRGDGNLYAWQALDDLGALSGSSGNVTSLRDKAGFGRTLTGSGAVAYTYPIVAAGNAAYLQYTSFPTTYDCFVVARPGTSTAGFRTLLHNSSGNVPMLLNGGSTALGVYGATAFKQAGSLTWPADTVGMAHVVFASGSSVSMSRDGGAIAATTGPGLTLGTTLSVLNDPASGQPFNNLYEILFTPPSLGIVSYQRVEGYLAHKWRGLGIADLVGLLPATHPFKNRPPMIGD